MVLVGPAGHVEADFADECLGHADIDAVDAREVDAADPVQFPAQVKLRGMAARVVRKNANLLIFAGGGTVPYDSSRHARACSHHRPRDEAHRRGAPSCGTTHGR